MPYWDRFDICEAYFCFAYHVALNDRDYYAIIDRLDQMEFRARPSLKDAPSNLTENGKYIYMDIIRSYFRK